MGQDGGKGETAGAAKWYELFSRGARDWLRHDEKVREAVRANLPEIVDWLWEAMKLPNLKARVGPSEETDWTREGWDRHGARSRLDRRRSFKELVKRRGAPGATPTFIDEDLRYRQLARRRQPAVHA